MSDEELTLSFNYCNNYDKLNENVRLQVHIQNLGYVAIPEGAMLELSAASYFKKQTVLLPSIPATKKEAISVTLEPRGYQKFDDLPSTISVAVFKPNTKHPYKLSTTWFSVTVDHWSGDLVSWRPRAPGFEDKRANIIVFGPIGQGKSTLVNSTMSLWHRVSRHGAIHMSDSLTSVTKETSYFSDHAGFGFLDTQGIEDKNYREGEFPMLLKGALPFKWDIAKKETSEAAEVYKETAETREIHSIIFVINQATRNLAGDHPKVVRLKHFIKCTHEMGLAPLVAVTMMDLVPDDEVGGVKAGIQALTSVSSQDIFLIYNDPEKIKGNLEHEKKLYHLLVRALDAANHVMQRKVDDAAQKKELEALTLKLNEKKRAEAQEKEKLRNAEALKEQERNEVIALEKEKRNKAQALEKKRLQEIREAAQMEDNEKLEIKKFEEKLAKETERKLREGRINVSKAKKFKEWEAKQKAKYGGESSSKFLWLVVLAFLFGLASYGFLYLPIVKQLVEKLV